MRRLTTFLWATLVLAAGVAYLLAAAGCRQQNAQSAPRDKTSAEQQNTNQNSMQEMMQSMMSGVVTPGVKPEDLPAPSSQGAKLVTEYCAQCHNLPSPAMHSADEWPGIAGLMFRRAAMCGGMVAVVWE